LPTILKTLPASLLRQSRTAARTDPALSKVIFLGESGTRIGTVIGKLIEAKREMGLETRRLSLGEARGNQSGSSKKDPTWAGDDLFHKCIHIFSYPWEHRAVNGDAHGFAAETTISGSGMNLRQVIPQTSRCIVLFTGTRSFTSGYTARKYGTVQRCSVEGLSLLTLHVESHAYSIRDHHIGVERQIA
jgi:hypothetical protein